MSAFLCPSFGAGYQAFNSVGAILAGGLIYTYQAGSTTPAATWTDSTQITANANPIVLDSTGRPTTEIWLQGGSLYKVVLKDSSNNTISTWDNIGGINDANYLGFSEWVAFGSSPSYVSTTSFTVSGNQTSIFQASRRLQLSLLSGTVYGTIGSSAYNSGTGLTTVNVSLDSGALDNTLYAVSYGFMSATNTSLPQLFISALNAALTGVPTAPTAAAGTDSTQIATTAFAMHMQSPTFTGSPVAPTPAAGDNSTKIATTAFVATAAFSSALPGISLPVTGLDVTNNGTAANWGVSAGSAFGILSFIGY